MRLKDKVAIITGGAQGLGEGVWHWLRRRRRLRRSRLLLPVPHLAGGHAEASLEGVVEIRQIPEIRALLRRVTASGDDGHVLRLDNGFRRQRP